MLNLPNRLTVARLFLIPVFIIILVYYKVDRDWLRFLALGIFSLAALTDALDGYLARRWGERTKLGTYLDPLADKLLLNTAFILLVLVKSLPRQLPLWLPIATISRDVILLLGSALILMIAGDLKLCPSYLGKLTTTFQAGTVIFTLLNVCPGVLWTVWILTLLLTILSFFDYLFKGSHIFNESKSRIS